MKGGEWAAESGGSAGGFAERRKHSDCGQRQAGDGCSLPMKQAGVRLRDSKSFVTCRISFFRCAASVKAALIVIRRRL